MKKAVKYFMALMAFVLVLGGCANQITPAADTSEPAQQRVSPENNQAKNTKTYVSEEYGFSLKYPGAWELRDREADGRGIIISANDRDDTWGGTNLNMNFEYTEGDVGIGEKEMKKEQFTNQSGLEFILSYNTADVEFANENEVKYDPDDISVFIGTDDIPGLIMFSYNQKTNPKGEEQLKDILNTVKKISGGQN